MSLKTTNSESTDFFKECVTAKTQKEILEILEASGPICSLPAPKDDKQKELQSKFLKDEDCLPILSLHCLCPNKQKALLRNKKIVCGKVKSANVTPCICNFNQDFLFECIKKCLIFRKKIQERPFPFIKCPNSGETNCQPTFYQVTKTTSSICGFWIMSCTCPSSVPLERKVFVVFGKVDGAFYQGMSSTYFSNEKIASYFNTANFPSKSSNSKTISEGQWYLKASTLKTDEADNDEEMSINSDESKSSEPPQKQSKTKKSETPSKRKKVQVSSDEEEENEDTTISS